MPVIIVAAAIAAVAALIGAAIAAGDEAKARQIRADAAKKIGETKLPVLDKLVAQKLSPEAAAKYLASTQSTEAQHKVLGKLMESVDAKGETAEDRAAYLRMQNKAGGIAAGAQSAVQREMAQRGMAGSGLSFALQQQGAQAAANRANEMGIESASAARGRYMDALMSSGQMAGQMRGQELDAWRAADAINMFNARQQSDADFRNQQIPQQNFDNEMARNAAEAGAMTGVAQGYERGAQGTRETAGGVGSAAMTAGSAISQQQRDEDYMDYLKSSGAKKS